MIRRLLQLYVSRHGRQARSIASGAWFGDDDTFAFAFLAFYGVFEGWLALAAVGVLTWMVLWMQRHAKTMVADIKNKTELAAETGKWFAVGPREVVAQARAPLREQDPPTLLDQSSDPRGLLLQPEHLGLTRRLPLRQLGRVGLVAVLAHLQRAVEVDGGVVGRRHRQVRPGWCHLVPVAVHAVGLCLGLLLLSCC